jgi:anion-transporting  ArsA/GET3 family ATPase
MEVQKMILKIYSSCFEIDPEKLLPEFWSEISMNLKDVIRHEIEHLTHGDI